MVVAEAVVVVSAVLQVRQAVAAARAPRAPAAGVAGVAGDWAAVCLLDRRFLQARTRAQLPPWIDRRTQGCDAFGQAFRALGAFYRGRRQAGAGGAALPDLTQGAASEATTAASAVAQVAASDGAK